MVNDFPVIHEKPTGLKTKETRILTLSGNRNIGKVRQIAGLDRRRVAEARTDIHDATDTGEIRVIPIFAVSV
jgi:hypothetical protein